MASPSCTPCVTSGHYVPVLMLTARGRPEDVLKGFEAGADDYLPKPFELAILLARVRGLLRRSQWARRDSRDQSRRPHPELPRPARRPRRAGAEGEGRTYQLTQMECDLLAYLIRNAGKAVSRKAHPRRRVGPARGHRYARHRQLHRAASPLSGRRPRPAEAARSPCAEWATRRCLDGVGGLGLGSWVSGDPVVAVLLGMLAAFRSLSSAFPIVASTSLCFPLLDPQPHEHRVLRRAEVVVRHTSSVRRPSGSDGPKASASKLSRFVSAGGNRCTSASKSRSSVLPAGVADASPPHMVGDVGRTRDVDQVESSGVAGHRVPGFCRHDAFERRSAARHRAPADPSGRSRRHRRCPRSLCEWAWGSAGRPIRAAAATAHPSRRAPPIGWGRRDRRRRDGRSGMARADPRTAAAPARRSDGRPACASGSRSPGCRECHPTRGRW